MNLLFVGIMIGYIILVGGAVVVAIKATKENAKNRLEWATEETEQIRKEVEEINATRIVDKEEHNMKIEEIYAEAEKILDKEYSKPLEDNEIVLLHELFERAKRDSRFKEGLEGIRLNDIYYEAIFIKCNRVRKLSDKAIEKWEETAR